MYSLKTVRVLSHASKFTKFQASRFKHSVLRITFNAKATVPIQSHGACSYTTSPIEIKSPYTDVKLPESPLPEYISENVVRWPDHTALECGFTGKTYTYAKVQSMCIKLAAFLIKIGMQPKDVITIILPNIPEFPIVMLGILEAGLIVSPISPLYTADEICKQVLDSNSKCIITYGECLSRALSVKSLMEFNSQQILKIICINDTYQQMPGGVINFYDIINQDFDTSRISRLRQNVHLDDTALLPYSSGTTGMPKGVCLTHKSVTANIEQLMHPDINLIEQSSGNYQSAVPCILPFFHVYGLCVVMLHALKKGAKLVTLPKFDTQAFLKMLKNNKGMPLYVAPAVILFLGSHESVKLEHLENIKRIVTGGAPCSASDIEKIQEKCQIPVSQAYGMTEASPVVTFPSKSCRDLSTVGPPVSNTLGKVVGTENPNLDLPVGQIGELCFKGPQIMKGYYNNPSATSDTIDQEGWLHTGDLGYINEQGNFYVLDRVKELIKVKGFQVAPAELEAVLRQHPDIDDAGVTSMPCRQSGETPVAFVVPKSNLISFNPTHVKDFVSKKVAPYKQISKVFKTDKIPRSLSGKILRRELKLLIDEMESKH